MPAHFGTFDLKYNLIFETGNSFFTDILKLLDLFFQVTSGFEYNLSDKTVLIFQVVSNIFGFEGYIKSVKIGKEHDHRSKERKV